MINVNKKEVERYLGYRGLNSVDENVSKTIDECIEEMNDKVTPRYTYKTFPIIWNMDEMEKNCEFAGIHVEDGPLLKNLKGCREIVLLAVTLGPAPDMLVRRAEVRDMLRAYVYQAVGAAMAEAWCEEVNDMVRSEAAERGLYTRPRFSPGYGDFPLQVQKDFERILNMPKTVGITLSESLLMTPTKSITAVIGLTENNTDCHRAGCEECNMHETCEYSRS
ncbi:MAG: Vitamin B12 dependent methionine synthase activation subunit [Eubacterium sp.]|nr:Vitamin B12 dependent methionine synthase activation subunit [Eubacterium sp.]